MLALEQVTKRYGAHGDPALDELDLDVARGQFAWVVGDTGSGKSTLIRLFTRQELPSSGEVWVAGERVDTMPDRKLARLRREIGLVESRPRLLERRSARDNIRFALSAIGIDRHEQSTRTGEALELTGLGEVADRRPADLSAGQRQLLTLARAVAKRPVIVLADEPTAALDAESAAALVRALEQANSNGLTVLVAAQDDALAGERARVIRLREGRIAPGDNAARHEEAHR